MSLSGRLRWVSLLIEQLLYIPVSLIDENRRVNSLSLLAVSGRYLRPDLRAHEVLPYPAVLTQAESAYKPCGTLGYPGPLDTRLFRRTSRISKVTSALQRYVSPIERQRGRFPRQCTFPTRSRAAQSGMGWPNSLPYFRCHLYVLSSNVARIRVRHRLGALRPASHRRTASPKPRRSSTTIALSVKRQANINASLASGHSGGRRGPGVICEHGPCQWPSSGPRY